MFLRCCKVRDLSMASEHTATVAKSFELWGCMEIVDHPTCESTGMIPVDREGTYFGLRTSLQQSYERITHRKPLLKKSDVVAFVVNFTPQGFLYCSTHMVGTIPLLQRMTYVHSGVDWGRIRRNSLERVLSPTGVRKREEPDGCP